MPRGKRADETEATALGPIGDNGLGLGNGAEEDISFSAPFMVSVMIEGTADLLFHRWDCDAVESKAQAAKNSKAKKTDNVESYLYRNDTGMICLPGEYLRQSIIHAAKFRQDPRSPRKSAMDLYKAGVISLTPLAPLGSDKYDYEHRCRVQVQRNGITRTRPAFKAGWQAVFELLVNVPEYIRPADLHAVISNAGRLVGLADFRPTYGRFAIMNFELITPEV